jgi:hypothetical protein
MLDIDGNAAGPLQEFLRYVAVSPVLDWIGRFTEDTQGSGRAPGPEAAPAAGGPARQPRCRARCNCRATTSPCSRNCRRSRRRSASIEFSEHGVNLDGVGASFLGGPLQLSGGTQRDGAIVIRMNGSASAEGMRATTALPALQRLGAKMSGSARFNGSVTGEGAPEHHRGRLQPGRPRPGAAGAAEQAAADALPLHFT